MLRGRGWLLVVVTVCVLLEHCGCGDVVYSNSWAVEISGGDSEADSIARKHGFINLGQVGSLEGVYHFVHEPSPARSRRSLPDKHRDLMAEEPVRFVEQQVVLKRVKRYSPPTDAKWPAQWYLHRKSHHDMNVELAWEQDIIGRGAVVSILDDGIEHTHPDLHDNYDALASYDFNNHDADPFPRYDYSNENKHGTRCAGEVAANKNGKCGVGAAYGAKVGGVRMLDGEVSDVVEASSLSLNPQHIDIYSSSWGPSDDGMTVDGPGKLAKQAFIDGITKGRQGLGSIFVWAAGNGGKYGDSCNCDGYAVSPYTISVGSASEKDGMPWYAEICSSTMAATYSSGGSSEKQIVTTDLHHACTQHHTGTSASAPLAAGILALALEANQNLTWRDVQYLLVYSSNPNYPKDQHWQTNGAGLKVSHQYGFGIINAAAVVNRARYWTTVPPQHNCTIDATHNKPTVQRGHPLEISIDASGCSLVYLEHAQAVTSMNFNAGRRGSVTIKLVSPQGTESTLLPYRRRDYHRDGLRQWPFMTVLSWGEDPRGTWKYKVEASDQAKATLESLQLVLYGTRETHVSVRSIPSECHPECQGGCAKPGAKFCDACKHFRMATSLECVERCPEATYTNYHMCRSCPHLCAECENNETCIRCQDGALKLSTGLCAGACPKLTFAAPNGSCLPCHHSCLSCSGEGEDHCTDCPGQFVLQSGSCILRSDCPEGEYFDGRALECRLCHKSCAKCGGKEVDECTACFTGYALQSGKCVVDVRSSRNCSSGRYYDDETKQCSSCPSGCTECSDEITCTVCDHDHFLQSQRVGESQEETRLCVTRCINGFYGDPTTHSCQPCPSYCNTCDSPDSCTSCAFNFTRPVDGQCPQPCHDEHYYDFPTKQCQPCVENCLHCIKPDSCLACQSGYFLNPKGMCVSSCPDHMITNQLSGTCIDTSCHTSCVTCYGPEANQCMSCHEGLIFHENSCLENCPQHTFFNGSSCHHCHDKCTSCSGPAEDNCLACPPGKVLDHFHCILSCPPGSFTSSDRECLACPLNCINCSSVDKCKDCEDGYLKLLPSNTCVRGCPPGHVRIKAECHPCRSHCERCEASLHCSKCQGGYVLYEPDNSCQQTCPNGYYDSKGKCAACRFPCSSCEGAPYQCTVCATDYAMYKESKLCKQCCNRDERERHPCCDCDKNDQECILTDDPFPKSTDSKGSDSPSYVAPLAIVVAVSIVVVLVVAVVVGVWMHKSRQFHKRYAVLPSVPKDPLEVLDDSESEAELYTAT